MKTRTVFTLAMLTFMVVLAIVVGQRMSGEAMAVLVGVTAGVAASIPASLLVVWLATRTNRQDSLPVETQSPPTTPTSSLPAQERVVIVQQPNNGYAATPNGNGYYMTPGGGQYLQPPPQPRHFTVVGGASEIESQPTYPQAQTMEEQLWLR